MSKHKISPLKAFFIFLIFTVYFYLLLFTLLPFLKLNILFNPALYWFITGYFLFIPLFISAIISVRAEGNKSRKEIMLSLYIKPFDRRDWKYSIIGLLSVFIFTGVIFGMSFLLNKYFGLRMLTTSPWFMEIHPFQGAEKMLLLVWLPMFFFNIVGEEILWRGYIQGRLESKNSWLFCAFLWWMFHLPFGIDLMLMLIPVILIIPYGFYKTKNTLVGIFIHGVYNGPLFVAVALGFIK